MADPTNDTRDPYEALEKKRRQIGDEISQGKDVRRHWIKYVDQYLDAEGHPKELAETDLDELAAKIVSTSGLVLPPGIEGPTRAVVQARADHGQAPLDEPPQENADKQDDPVMMFNGQLVYDVTDLRINGAGIGFAFRRIYKNQAAYDSPLGFNWDHSYNLWLRVSDQVILRSTGMLREDIYVRHAKAGFNYWVPPSGQHGIIEESFPSYIWRSPGSVRFFYEPDSVDGTRHRIERIEDRYGNYLKFRYQERRLHEVEVNHPGRLIVLAYDVRDRIESVQDYTTEFGAAGRRWSYHYDDFGDLIGVTSPATERYPEGLTTCYEYSSSQVTGALQHNLTRIIDPAGQMYLENEYGMQENLLSFNRVVRQRQGAGHTLFEYANVNQEFDFDYTEAEQPTHQTMRVAPNGHITKNIYNHAGNLLLKEEKTLQGGLIRLLRWRYRYNEDGALIGELTADGRMTQYYYGRDHFLHTYNLADDEVERDDHLTPQRRMAFENLLAMVRREKFYDFTSLNLNRGVWGDFFPPVLGVPSVLGVPHGSNVDIITKFTYEPDFQQIATASDPRYTRSVDPADTDPPREDPRYKETRTEYTYTGPSGSLYPAPSGTGGLDTTHLYLERIRYPELQTISQSYDQYDNRGRLLKSTDQEGIITVNEYFGSGAGVRQGYLKSQTIDPGGLPIRTEYEVNETGIVTTVIHPKAQGAPPGEFRTVNEINALDQITRTIVSPPFAYETRFFYDRNGQSERVERDLKDESNAPLLGGVEVSTYCYDEQFNLLEETIGGADLSTHLTTQHRYNKANKRTRTTLPRGNQIWHSYNERLLHSSVTRGACTPEAATTRTEYSGDGLKTRVIDGRGHATDFQYDAFGRLIATVDSLGHVARTDYDKADNVTVERFFERQADGTYLFLSRSDYEYDELGRRIVERDNLFQTPLSATNPAVDYLNSPGPGTPINTEYFYDRKGRLVKVVDGKGQVTLSEYDNLDRKTRVTDALSNYTTLAYDVHSNLTRRDLHEQVKDPATGTVLREDVSSTLHDYDQLDRRIATTDSLGNTTHYFYDSLGRLVKQTDPLGNVLRFEFDVYGRQVAEIAEQTSTGIGGGQSVPSVITRSEYDENGSLLATIDAKNNRTEQEYDELDRPILRRFPDNSTEQYRFDANDNIVSYRDNNGLEHLSKFDELNRLIRKDLDASQLAGNIQGATFEAFTYDGLGRNRQEKNDFATTDRQFDSLGRIWEESLAFHVNVPGIALTKSYRLKREFDVLGNPVLLTYPSGRKNRYLLDELHRIKRIENVDDGANYPGSGTLAVPYDVVKHQYRGGRLDKTNYGNGTSVAYSYDQGGRIIQIAHKDANNANLLTIQQLYDAAGNIRLKNDVLPAGNKGETHKYNSLYWLTKTQESTNLQVFDPATLEPAANALAAANMNGQTQINARLGPLANDPVDFTFQYDLLGNRKEQRTVQVPLVFTSNNLNQYTNIGTDVLAYDKNGNLTQDGQRRYRYDYRDQLVRVEDVATGQNLAQFFYDAQGRRVLSLMDGHLTHFIFDSQNHVEEYRGNTLWAQYVQESGIDSHCQIAVDGNEHWYHTDLVRSTRLLTNAAGNISGYYRYTPFGSFLDNNGPYNPFTFNGRRYDAVIDSYDFRLRQYMPALGRFQQRDAKDATNAYLFLENNPLTAIDPLAMERTPSDQPMDDLNSYPVLKEKAPPEPAKPQKSASNAEQYVINILTGAGTIVSATDIGKAFIPASLLYGPYKTPVIRPLLERSRTSLGYIRTWGSRTPRYFSDLDFSLRKGLESSKTFRLVNKALPYATKGLGVLGVGASLWTIHEKGLNLETGFDAGVSALSLGGTLLAAGTGAILIGTGTLAYSATRFVDTTIGISRSLWKKADAAEARRISIQASRMTAITNRLKRKEISVQEYQRLMRPFINDEE